MQIPSKPEMSFKECEYFPWGKLIQKVESIIVSRAPRNGSLLDVCCDHGLLLYRLEQSRGDLCLNGLDEDPNAIGFDRATFPKIGFDTGTVATYSGYKDFDVVVCAGNLHFQPYHEQETFVRDLAGLVKRGGFAIVADPCIWPNANEQDRRLGAAVLGNELLTDLIRRDAPPSILRAGLEVLGNDVLGFQYKLSMKSELNLLEGVFGAGTVTVEHVWPINGNEYGDYIFIAEKK